MRPAGQRGLAWLLQHSPHTLLISGTADVDHLEANLAAGGVLLDDATLAGLDAIGTDPLVPPERLIPRGRPSRRSTAAPVRAAGRERCS